MYIYIYITLKKIIIMVVLGCMLTAEWQTGRKTIKLHYYFLEDSLLLCDRQADNQAGRKTDR